MPDRKKVLIYSIIIIAFFIVGIGIGTFLPTLITKKPNLMFSPSLFAPKKEVTELFPPPLLRPRFVTMNSAYLEEQDRHTGKTLTLTDSKNVRISLDVPPDAVAEGEFVTMVPFVYNSKQYVQVAGVIVTTLSKNGFVKPMTLTFDFGASPFTVDAPDKGAQQIRRLSNPSQVLLIDTEAKAPLPQLIARPLETSTRITIRVNQNGAYLLTLDGKHQKAYARMALHLTPVSDFSILEAATVLLAQNESLTGEEKKKIEASVQAIIANPSAGAIEQSAAYRIQNLVGKQQSSHVSLAFAEAHLPQAIIAGCASDAGSSTDYVTYAAFAQGYGDDALAATCMAKAKKRHEDFIKKVIDDPNASIEDIMQAMRFADYNTELFEAYNEQLFQKARSYTTTYAKSVLDNPDATLGEVEKAMDLVKKLFVKGDKERDDLEAKLEEKKKKIKEDLKNRTDRIKDLSFSGQMSIMFEPGITTSTQCCVDWNWFHNQIDAIKKLTLETCTILRTDGVPCNDEKLIQDIEAAYSELKNQETLITSEPGYDPNSCGVTFVELGDGESVKLKKPDLGQFGISDALLKQGGNDFSPSTDLGDRKYQFSISPTPSPSI